MDDLIGRLVANAGVDRTAAERAVGTILQFLQGPPEKVRPLFGMLNAIGGPMGGSQLMAAGRSVGRIQAVTREAMRVAHEIAGEDAVGEIVGAIPALGQLV